MASCTNCGANWLALLLLLSFSLVILMLCLCLCLSGSSRDTSFYLPDFFYGRIAFYDIDCSFLSCNWTALSWLRSLILLLFNFLRIICLTLEKTSEKRIKACTKAYMQTIPINAHPHWLRVIGSPLKSLKQKNMYKAKMDMTSFNVWVNFISFESKSLDHCRSMTMSTEIYNWMATWPQKKSIQ